MPQTSTRITEIARVIVSVSDQDRALEFYVGTLGFEQLCDVPFGDGERWIEVAPPGARTTIALASPMDASAIGAMTGISFATADIDALHSELGARGADIDAEVMRLPAPVPPMFFFRDPDGNTLHVTEEG